MKLLRSRSVQTVAALLITVVLAAGCTSEEPEPKFAEEPTAEPTAEEEKKETAEEFIRRWNDEQTEMQKGDTSGYRAIAGECGPCMATADKVDEYYAAGGYVRTDGRSIVSINRVPRQPRSTATTFEVVVDSAPTKYRTSSSTPEESFSGGRVTYGLLLKKVGDTWRLLDTWENPS